MTKGVLAEWLRIAKRERWTVEYTGGGHLRWIPPNGGKPIISSATISGGHRAIMNTRVQLRRAGLPIP